MTPEDGVAIQQLDRVESWVGRNVMKFNKGKCRVLHLKRNNYLHPYRIWVDVLETSSEVKDLCPGRQQVDYEPAVCPCGQECQWCLVIC